MSARERLDDLSRPAWRDRFDERISAFETTLDDFEPPVSWGDVQSALEDHRADPDRGS